MKTRSTNIFLLKIRSYQETNNNPPQYLDNKTVDGQIFPAVCTGFTDTVPGMREQTVKSMLQIAGRLSESTIDNQLLKFLAKAQTDPEPPIRTNTTICISKVSCHFSDATRRKVLIPAFLRALKDPFMHARNAGLLSLGCTAQYYGEPEVASRILPSVCPMLMDHDKIVRDQALKTVKLFLEKIERYHKGNPDKAPVSTRPISEQAPDPQEAAAKGWTGWAMSSVSNIATKYTGQAGPPSNIGEIQKPVVPKPTPAPTSAPEPTKPASVTSAPAESHDSDDMGESGWDDDWDNVKTTPAPKTKSSLKLGGVKAKTSALDDDDDFIANILKEEQGHLKKETKGKPTASLSRPKSPEVSKASPALAPWDAPRKPIPQNNKVKITPWEEPAPTSQNTDLLSSYFSNTASDFFGEMGAEKPKDSLVVKSEWDDFNIKTVESEPENAWDDWGSEKPGKQPAKPALAKPALAKPVLAKPALAKPTPKPNVAGEWGSDGGDWSDNWESKKPQSKPTTQKSSFKPAKKTASPAFNEPVRKTASPAFDNPVKKTASPAFNKPVKKTASPAIDDWNDSGWDDLKPAAKPTKQPANSFKPVQKQPKPAQPTSDSWGDEGWDDLPPAKTASKPAKTPGFQPAATTSSGGGFESWDDGWSEEPVSREEKRRQQRERRGNRASRGVRKKD